jgi:putative ABC transport system permease protein
VEQANADLAIVAANIASLSPSTNKGWGVTVEPLRQGLVPQELRTTSWVLAGAAGFVLLIACANVANLMLVRGAARTREIAVRASIGGSRSRIVRQLLTESALVGLLGGALGIGLGAALLQATPYLVPPGFLPVWLHLKLDVRMIAFTVAVAVTAAGLFGLAPAWQAVRTPLAAILRSGGRTATGGDRVRALLAAGEVAVAMLLVAGAGLLLRTFESLSHVDPGFQPDHVLTMYVSLANSRYPKPENAMRFYRGIEAEIAAVPGVRAVGMSTILPADGWDIGQGFEVVGQPEMDRSHQPAAHYQIVSSGYFRTLGIELTRGRPFDDRDTTASTPVCIVNEEFARRYLAGRDALSAQINVQGMAPEGPRPVVRQVVGVSHQVKVGGLAEKENELEIYVPQRQNPWFWSAISVKTAGDPGGLTRAVQAAVARVDRQEALTRIRTMDQVLAETVSTPRFLACLTGAFAGIALALAAVGIFGVLAFSVGQRTREFGIRLAVGAQSGQVLWMVLGEAMQIAGAGTGAGLIAAAVLTRSLSTLLFGVVPLDALTFIAAAGLLGLVALAACLAPAWRASRVDPASVLHQE